MKKRMVSFLTSLVMVFSLFLIVPDITASALDAQTAVNVIKQLKKEFPNNSTWAPTDDVYIENDGWYKGYIGYSGSGAQCQGFAFLCLDRFFNNAPSSDYYFVYNSDYCIGDEIRTSSHSYVVVGIDNNTISIVDCNANYRNGIRWTTKSRSSLYAEQVYVRRKSGNNLKTLDTTWYASQNPVDIGDNVYVRMHIHKNNLAIADVNGNVELQSEVKEPNQIWLFDRHSDGSYTIKNCGTKKYFNAHGGADANGTNINTTAYNGSKAQRWYIYGRWSGEYILKPQCSDRVLDINGGSNKVGDNAQLYTYNNSVYQQLAFYKLDKVPATTFSVDAGTSYTDTTFKWEKNSKAKEYSVKIWKDKKWQGDAYMTFVTTDTQWSVTLPEGTYEAYVDSINYYSYQGSNSVVFTVSKGTCPHNYDKGTITTKATCTANGVITYTCSICNTQKNESISATGHSYSSDWTIDKEATCTEKGSKSHHCTVCGTKKDITEIPATKHDMGEWSFIGSKNNAYQIRRCSKCDYEETKPLDENCGFKITGTVPMDVNVQIYLNGLNAVFYDFDIPAGDFTTDYIISKMHRYKIVFTPKNTKYDSQTYEYNDGITESLIKISPKFSLKEGTSTVTTKATTTKPTATKTTTTTSKPTATTTTTTTSKPTATTTTTTAKVTTTTTKKATTTVAKKVTTKKATTTTAKKTTSKKSLKKARVSIAKTSYAYTGKAIKPSVTVKYGSTKLKNGTDYTVSYKNNTKTGKATITIKGKGNYTGTVTKTFNIFPKKATLSSVKSAKTKTLKVTWKKDSQASGYEVVYATNSRFTSGKKTVTVSKNSTTAKTISKLTKGKTYYVKVRSYKTINGKKIYGAYSDVKKVKCK